MGIIGWLQISMSAWSIYLAYMQRRVVKQADEFADTAGRYESDSAPLEVIERWVASSNTLYAVGDKYLAMITQNLVIVFLLSVIGVVYGD